MSMNQSNLAVLLQNRKVLKKLLDSLSLEQINKIPIGFNNNVLWNVAHVIAVQQILLYGLSNQPFVVEKNFVNRFLPGTKPDVFYDETMISEVKSLLAFSYDRLIQDIQSNMFGSFNPYSTALRFEINDLESAITFNLYHETLHTGHILNLRKFL
jgi:hypothetical protein